VSNVAPLSAAALASCIVEGVQKFFDEHRPLPAVVHTVSGHDDTATNLLNQARFGILGGEIKPLDR
jgi:hypothetical protein